jgi:hypothetical protein
VNEEGDCLDLANVMSGCWATQELIQSKEQISKRSMS